MIFNVLSTNSLINGTSDIIKQYRLGLSDTKGNLKMTPLSEQQFSEDCINYGGRGITDSNLGEEEVELTTIDSLHLSKLDFIKLDVQGFELKALKGGEGTIKSNYPIMFIENYLNLEVDQQALQLLNDWGYVLYRLLCTDNKEDCILVHPERHIEEIKFIETQEKIKWTK